MEEIKIPLKIPREIIRIGNIINVLYIVEELLFPYQYIEKISDLSVR